MLMGLMSLQLINKTVYGMKVVFNALLS